MQPGTQLGHYEILSAIGKGGMGEVWRARDSRLGRDVAIKTLPAEFAQDADRIARFQREAKLLASLNHPNIAAIHGLEEADGKHFLVLELVEGDTLGDLLGRGAIPVEDALQLALQIADALKAAHESGVVHRDLKPDNIKVSAEGTVKVLDFGLAKAMAGDEAQTNVSNSPTLSMAATQAGMILGTAAYMSPEQAKGRAVDRRADIWAFGCVLFEMLSGRQSFGASDVTESLAAVIRSDPEWSALPASLNPRLHGIVERCLEKQLVRRYQDIGDVKFDLGKVLADPDGVIVRPVAEAVETARPSRLPWIATALGISVTAVAVWFLKPEPPAERLSVRRFSIELPTTQSLPQGTGSLVGLSPDGQTLVYRAADEDGFRLYQRRLDEVGPTLIPGTEDAVDAPFFSPDSAWLGFVTSDDTVKKVELEGGRPVTAGDLDGGTRGASWGPNDEIILSQGPRGFALLTAASGEPVPIAPDSDDDRNYFYPQILPGGGMVLYTSADTGWPDAGDLMLFDLNTNQTWLVMEDASAGRYVPTGHLVFVRGGDLWAIRFDLERMEVEGSPVVVEQGIRVEGGGAVQFAVAEDGTLAYIPGDAAPPGTTGTEELVSVDREGNETSLGAELGSYWSPVISNDGGHIAVGSIDLRTGSVERDIRIWDVLRRSWTRLTVHEARDGSPVWSEDDESIFFRSARDGGGVYRRASNGTGEAELRVAGALRPRSLTADGTLLLTVFGETDDVGILRPGGELETLIGGSFSEEEPAISPNQRWIAFQSDRTGRNEVYVRPFPDVESDEWIISTGGGAHPVWSRDGTELFFDDDEGILVVAVETEEETFSRDLPRKLFDGNYWFGTPRDWDVSPDGERFLMIKRDANAGDEETEADEGERDRIIVVINFFEVLKDRVPVP